MTVKERATIEDLYNMPDDYNAEIVNGEVVLMPPTGLLSSNAAGAIYTSLRLYSQRTGFGRAYADNTGFSVDLADRDTFSPDVAFYHDRTMTADFGDGAPQFAVEVRSKNDYGPLADTKLNKKRDDYFAAGTLVVWIVNVLRSPYTISVYRASDPNNVTVYKWGDLAEAEPAVPGWRMVVDELFE